MSEEIEKTKLKGRAGNGGRREGSGRKPFEPTESERKNVEAMSGFGVPMEQMAILIRDGIHIDTLRDKFKTELLAGKAKANSKIGRTLFQKAMSGDSSALIFWAKTQMRWREEKENQNEAQTINITIDGTILKK